MNKPLCIVSSPLDTFSGYGARSRDFIKSLIKVRGEEWDIRLLSQRWGSTPFGFLDNELEDEKDLIDRIIPQMVAPPDVWFQITVPNEFQKIGKHLSIGVTAGIETTICDAGWVDGCNRMDMVIVSSNHAKAVFENTKFEKVDKTTNQNIGSLELTTPIEVLFEGVDIEKYFKSPPVVTDLTKSLSSINENFAFLFVGHWLQGDFGEDRKNVWYTIKAFLEVFKNKLNPPALVLKTNSGPTSILDRENILNRIDKIRKLVNGRLPNIYLIHGDLEDEDMNDLYNHPKIKAMVSFTKGEGFGRPLLEFTTSEKPVIASGWSGHIDFLDKEHSVLIGGSLKEIHPSAQIDNMLIGGSQWFTPDDSHVGHAFNDVYNNYKNYLPGAKKQADLTNKNFTLTAMTDKLGKLLDEKTKPIPKFIPLNLPNLNTMKLPTLKKIE
jgi:hypothetical protein